jgi:hypothetical protein
MKDTMRIEVFSSFEEENKADRQRRAGMTPKERCREFAQLQERAWGTRWTSEPMVRKASWEILPWDEQ